MSRCCGNRNINRNGQVMGEFGTTRIALRGPGCINGTGRCNVAGASGRCTDRFGMGDDFVNRPCSNLAGTGGGRDCCDDVAGDFGRRCCNNNVAGDFGRRCCNNNVAGDFGRRCPNNNVAGDFGRRRCCHSGWNCLETPTTVPR